MGLEAGCVATIGGKTVRGRARLETDVLQFRGGDVMLTVPFKKMKDVSAAGGQLALTGPDGRISLRLGKAAPKWAQKILHPPSRLQKLGVKPDWRVSVVGSVDAAFVAELEGAIAFLSVGRLVKACDAIFVGAFKAAELGRLARIKTSLKPNGALWIVRPKGRREISEAAVMNAGKAAGLVDVKVVSFSATHTAEKFVIPLASR
jgi:hypothetical protein